MIRRLLAALAALCLLVGAPALAAQQQTINVGTTANDGTGDSLRTAFGKVNANTAIVEQRLQGGAFAALSLAAVRPVDLIMIGDSNQRKDATGFDDGFGKALATRFGLYASPMYVQENAGTAQSNEGFATGAIAGAVGAETGAPSPQAEYAARGYLYQASGAIGNNNGMGLLNVTPGLDVNANLRAHYSYGTFASGSGSFVPAARRNSDFATIGTGSTVNTNTGVAGRAITTVDVAAGARNVEIEFKWQLPGGTASVGPTTEFWLRVENLDRPSGISVSTFAGLDGQSMYDMAAYVIGLTDAQLKNYLADVTYLQRKRGFDPLLVVYVNSAPNDTGESSTPSLGPNPTGSPTGAGAYVDNLRAITTRMDAMWSALGYDAANLTYMIMPSHPISDPDSASYIAYRAAVARWTAGKSRVTVVDTTTLVTAAQMVTNNWFLDNTTDRIHLNQPGYEGVASLVAAQIK